MARYFPDTANDYLYLNSTPVTAEPLTICAWIKPDDVIGLKPIVSIDSTVRVDAYNTYVYQAGPAVYFRAEERVGANARKSELQTVSAGVWQHTAGVYDTGEYRLAYLDGTPGVPNTTFLGLEPQDLNQIRIGSDRWWSEILTTDYFKGGICEVAIWNAVLSAPAIQDMAINCKSALFYPTNLVFYARLTTTEDYDEIGANNLSMNGALSVVAHPVCMVYPGVFLTNAVRMDPPLGEPTQGDKGVWDVENYDTRHASDIAADALLRHLPSPVGEDDNDIAYVDTDEWVIGSAADAGIVDTDEKASVSANDTTPGYLNGKLVAGTNINLTEGNDGGDETLTITNTGTADPSDAYWEPAVDADGDDIMFTDDGDIAMVWIS